MICFADNQLERLIARLAAFHPRYIFTTTVTSQWKLWHGRLNEGAFFERHGYIETRRHWLPEWPGGDTLRDLALPKRYWVNLSVRLYEPAEPVS